jgi:3-hydroxyacyl-[acyl-carrier-protein] dehydratase
MSSQPLYDSAIVREILPHASPFLFVDRVMDVKLPDSIIAERDLSPDEPFFAGHFPGRPIMPGVLVTEALAQTCGLLAGLAQKEKPEFQNAPPPVFFLAGVNMKFVHTALPGDTLRLEAHLKKQFGALSLFDVAAYVRGSEIARGTLTLGEQK